MKNRYVNLIKSAELFFKNYASTKGRSSRSALWWWILADVVVISTILDLVDAAMYSVEGTDWFYDPEWGGLLGILLIVITLIPYLSLYVRRLQDTNRSGWLLLLTFTIIGIIPLLVWFCSKGTEGVNDYGEDEEAGL